MSYDPLLTPAQAAVMLGVSTKTLSRLAGDNKIQSLRTPGGHRRYRRSALLQQCALMAAEGGRR
jgi:putative resolvase